MTPQSPGYDDLDAHLDKLAAADLLHVIDRPIDKSREMHPLVRWQYRGGIPGSGPQGLPVFNVTDAKGRSYPGAEVAIGALAATPHIYAMGMEQARGRYRGNLAGRHGRAHRSQGSRVCAVPGNRFNRRRSLGRGQGVGCPAHPHLHPGLRHRSVFHRCPVGHPRPGFGIQNLGLYRGNLKAPNRVVVMMERATLAGGGGWHWRKYKALSQKMPVAVVLGARHPSWPLPGRKSCPWIPTN